MGRNVTPFTKQDYKGEYNLLAGEKGIINNALILCEGSITDAQKLLCPTGKPYYSCDFLRMRLEQHGIDHLKLRKKKDHKSFILKKKRLKSKVSKEVRERLDYIEKINNIKLRS